ncbi:POU class 2 homeobox associating factor 3 isoform X2 [Hemicordylus capensis]|uniref:POU class 2 homeobox associating factor 3 isoform X2 n=1 Tax=Hemicordylus capensis TaxID=884348 RepID=UPI002303F50C|nr:POU class 2 homeobox associating factor 3 isoform X2 [Hemicordylus capensis]
MQSDLQMHPHHHHHTHLFPSRSCFSFCLSRVSGEGSGSCIQFTESFPPPCAAPYIEAEAVSSSSGCLQPQQFQNPTSCEEIPSSLEHLVDSFLLTEVPLEASLGAAQDNTHCSPNSSFHPGPACLNQSLTPASPDSSDLSFDYSYSPAQLPSYVPLSYSSPSPLDTKSCMYPLPEGSPYQQHSHVQYSHTPSTCYCTSCSSQHLDTFRVPEYFPYTNMDCSRDYAPSVSAADDFFRRDRSWDTCYS